MSGQCRLRRLALLAALLCLHSAAAAAFPPSETDSRRQPLVGQTLWPANGVGLCVSAGSQNAQDLVGDGLQGAIVVWSDARPSANGADIYAQRLSAGGLPLWTSDGIAVITADNDQTEPKAISDGAGGALLAWNDLRQGGSAIYAQRLDGSGHALWAAQGISVTTGAADHLMSQLLTDGSGGAFVIWEENTAQDRFDTNLFAQRISAAGELLWTTPATITLAAGEQYDPAAVFDDSGGFMVVWADLRTGSDQNLYAQHISGSGLALWANDGIPVSSSSVLQRLGDIARDGQGGVFVAWQDYRSPGGQGDAYLMRLTASGERAWLDDLPVMAAADLVERPTALIADGSGGAIMLADGLNPSEMPNADVLAQRIDAGGALVWGPQPVNVTPWAEQQTAAAAVPDGSGGAYLAWMDNFSEPLGADMVAQHLDSAGAAQWPGHGVVVVASPGVQNHPQVLSDGGRGLIIAWQDYRSDPDSPDLYAQRISEVNQLIFPLMRKNSR